MVVNKRYRRLTRPPRRSFFLLGVRGVGKSTWARQQFPDAPRIDLLDEGRYQDYLADPSLFGAELDTIPAGSWVVVDEIQRLPNLLNEVHRFIEDRGLKFALLGSSARKLKAAGVNLLAGRALNKTMHPLTPAELGGDFGLEVALDSGTIPLVWVAEERRAVLESYVQLYLREEIRAEALVRNLPGFARFLPIAALCHGEVVNVSGLARDCGVARTTVNGYLDILEDTLLAYRLPAFEAKLRVRERRHPKLYWVDPGLVRAVKKRRGFDCARGARSASRRLGSPPSAGTWRGARPVRGTPILGAPSREPHRSGLPSPPRCGFCGDRGQVPAALSHRNAPGIARGRRASGARAASARLRGREILPHAGRDRGVVDRAVPPGPRRRHAVALDRPAGVCPDARIR